MILKKLLPSSRHKDNDDCPNHLHQDFNQKAPNIVWTNDFTYIKVSGKWHYLCIVMDLFSRKAISRNISEKPNVELVMNSLKKLILKEAVLPDLCFILIKDLNILLSHL